MELASGLIGALLGGLLALAGSLVQGHFQNKQLLARFEQERTLAAEEHQRSQVATENERLRTRIQDQVDYGDRVLRAAARFQSFAPGDKAPEERGKVLAEAIRFVGLNWNRVAPYRLFLHEDEIEDPELRALVSEHRSIVWDVDFGLMFADGRPDELPANCQDLLERADGIARRVGLRCRALQRVGKPF